MAFPSLLMLGLYSPVAVARASFALPRSHHGEVRLTVGGIESALDPRLNMYWGLIDGDAQQVPCHGRGAV